MYYKNIKSSGRGLDKRSGQPRLVGDILNEYFEKSNEPLAKGYRKHLASIEINAEKGDKLYV